MCMSETIIPTRQRPTTGVVYHLGGPFDLTPTRSIRITRVLGREWIDEDMPSCYGSHLLGYEGEYGWRVEYEVAR